MSNYYKQFYTGIDLLNNEIKRGVLYKLSTDPTGADLKPGLIWYNTSDKQVKYSDGTNVLVLVDLSLAQTLSNKVIDADNNTITNLEAENLKSGVLLTSLTGSVNDTTWVSSKGVKDYVDSVVAGYGQFIGDWDASGGEFPSSGSGSTGSIQKGDYWRISVAGTIPGVTPNENLEIGDVLVAKEDSPTTGAGFFALQANLVKATTEKAGVVELATKEEAEARTDTERAVTPSSLSGFGVKRIVGVPTDGVSMHYYVIHNLGKNLFELSVRLVDGQTEEEFETLISPSSGSVDPTNRFSTYFSVPYPSGSFVAIVIG